MRYWRTTRNNDTPYRFDLLRAFDLTYDARAPHHQDMTQVNEVAGPSVPPLTLGWRMKMALEYGGVSRATIADALKVDPATITRWTHEKGAPPRPIYLKEWALRCGVSYDWLANGGGDAPGGHVDPAALERAIQQTLALAEAAGLTDDFDFKHALTPVLNLASGGATRYRGEVWRLRQAVVAAVKTAAPKGGTCWAGPGRSGQSELAQVFYIHQLLTA